MPTISKKAALSFERVMRRELTAILGQPGKYGHWDQWTLAYGNDGATVTVGLIPARAWDFQRGWSAPWLACRYHNDAFVKDGYTLPREAINWPGQFTYPSGKSNFDLFGIDDVNTLLAQMSAHLMRIAAPGSAQRYAFGEIQFEPAIAA